MDEDEDTEHDAESNSSRLCTTPQLIIMLPITRAKVVQISFDTPLFLPIGEINTMMGGAIIFKSIPSINF